MEASEVRLRLMEVLVPIASKHSLVSGEIVAVCTQLERYVIESPAGEELPPSPSRKTLTRPSKDNRTVEIPGFLDPTHGGQVEAKPR